MAERPDITDPVERARLAVAVLAVAGPAVGGLWLRARPAPARDALLTCLDRALPEAARIAPESDVLSLVGGVDVALSLAEGARRESAGLLDRTGRLTLTGAERASPALSALLAQALDAGGRSLLAIDEGEGPDEALAPGLAARTSLFVDLGGLGLRSTPALSTQLEGIGEARARWREIGFDAGLETVLGEYAAILCVGDLRHVLAARAATKAIAALRGADCSTREDLDLAAGLILVPRGQMPTPQPEVEEPEDAATRDDPSDGSPGAEADGLEDRVSEAEAVILPPALLEMSVAPSGRGAGGAGAGAALKGTRRGRPLPSRRGHSSARARIDPVATLRAAIPWQRLRAPSPSGQSVALRPSDIRIRRFEERSERVVIFAVDASGSQAMARMAEAKGAVECLLAEAYRRRDQVALVAFRGSEADVLLPPTRALLRARNALSGLPGGGATPLAAGLRAAAGLALRAKTTGATPLIVLLTDGRANIALDGAADRSRATADAETVARSLAAAKIECLVLDTARRQAAPLAILAGALGARYVPLPFAGSKEMSAAVSAALDA